MSIEDMKTIELMMTKYEHETVIPELERELKLLRCTDFDPERPEFITKRIEQLEKGLPVLRINLERIEAEFERRRNILPVKEEQSMG